MSRRVLLLLGLLFALPLSAAAVDSDLDGVADPTDNCVFAANPSQLDSGGLNTLVGNGRGDACECGDASDDGPVTGSDVAELRQSLADPIGAPLSPGGVAKCTVHGDRPEPCGLVDIAILRRALEPAPLAPGIAQACSPALCPTCASAYSPQVGGCQIFPESDPWHLDVSGLAVHGYSATYISALEGATPKFLRLDFGSTQPEYGIPYVVAPPTQPLVSITYGTDGVDLSDESDPGPFPIPLDAPIEGGTPSAPNPTAGDRHVVAVRQGTCDLYELFLAERTVSPAGFRVALSAHWSLLTPVPRPNYWPSGWASGLPMLPGLLRREEFARGRIDHAIAVLLPNALRGYVPPASAMGPSMNLNHMPYGARLRLRGTFSEAGYSADAVVLIRALKEHGLIFVDQGSAMYAQGVPDPGFGPLIAELNTGAQRIPLAQFDVVQTGDVPVCGFVPPGPGGHCF